MSLWSDLDNTQQPLATSGGSAHTRRPTEQVMLSSLRHWLLQDYVAAYCHALAATRIFRRCYWIDALGALPRDTRISTSQPQVNEEQGKKRKAKKQVAQSTLSLHPALQPVVTLAQQLVQAQRPIALYGYLLNAGRKSRSKQAVQIEVLPKEGGIITAGWQNISTFILHELDQAPALFLLNPLGTTLFNDEQLLPLYQRTVPTELLFLLSHRQLLHHLHLAHHRREHATTLTTLLRTDRWKNLPTREEESQQAIIGLVELFGASMQRHFQFPVQQLELPGLPRLAMLTPLPYTLLFATRRQDSLLCMNDALCRQQHTLELQNYQGLLNEDWFMQQYTERQHAQRAEITQRIIHLGKAQRRSRWPDLRQQILLDSFGGLTVQEYDAIILQLLAQAIVRCEWQRVPGAPDTPERVPGSGDTLRW